MGIATTRSSLARSEVEHSSRTEEEAAFPSLSQGAKAGVPENTEARTSLGRCDGSNGRNEAGVAGAGGERASPGEVPPVQPGGYCQH